MSKIGNETMATISYYRKGLLVPFAAVALAGIIVGASHIFSLPPWLDLPLEVSGLLLAGSVIVLPAYSILALAMLRRSFRNSVDENTAIAWAIGTPLVIAVVVVLFFGLRGLWIGQARDGVAIGWVVAMFVLTVGYAMVGLVGVGRSLSKKP
jgi:hypothetical protein